MSADIDIDALIQRMSQPGPIDDDGIDHEPDPPAWSDAESDRAADRYEAWLDAKATQ